MNLRSVVIAVVIGTSMLASEAMYAAPFAGHTPANAVHGKDQLVKFSLRNGTDAPMKIKAGEAEMTLKPGEIVPVKLAVGVKIVAQEATAHSAQGSVLLVVNAALGDATLVLS